PQWFAEAAYPRLRSWLQGWLGSSLFEAVMAKP
ncbi:glutathione S-transferase, partial [Pseudomonas soli]|nr:glutathione S-transferase [Pseudomonas soli]